jgi:ketosteroid isomerase-like protein
MTIATDKAAIETVISTFNKAHYDKDAAAVAALYAPEAVLFDLAPPLSHKVDEKAMAEWFDTWEGPVRSQSRDLKITAGGDAAFSHGLVQVSAVTREGGEEAVWWMRATMCFVRVGGAWKIAHEHTSVPFHMDGSFRAAMDLEP